MLLHLAYVCMSHVKQQHGFTNAMSWTEFPRTTYGQDTCGFTSRAAWLVDDVGQKGEDHAYNLGAHAVVFECLGQHSNNLRHVSDITCVYWTPSPNAKVKCCFPAKVWHISSSLKTVFARHSKTDLLVMVHASCAWSDPDFLFNAWFRQGQVTWGK